MSSLFTVLEAWPVGGTQELVGPRLAATSCLLFGCSLLST